MSFLKRGSSASQPAAASRPSRRRLPAPRQRYHLEIESLECRNLLSVTFYSFDGTGNNIANPTWGSAGSDLLRLSPVAYTDGISTPSLATDPSARAISNTVNSQSDPTNPGQDLGTVDGKNLSAFGYVWGQFIDHDMGLTPGGGASFPIQVAAGDPIGGAGDLPFTRSVFDPNTGTSTSNPRQQLNVNTSFLDLSQVYGSNATVADALRTRSGGLLKTSPGNMLPFNNTSYFSVAQLTALNMVNDAGAVASDKLFATGDVRGNENLELTALQTLFVRNHNRLATQLQKLHPGWTDEQLYQEARKLNIATEQMITYQNYLPDLLGPDAMKAYTGYNPNVDPAIATEFSTVGFRFGHSLLSSNIERQGNNGLDITDASKAGASISLAQDFFDPTLLNPNGVVDPLTGHTSSDIGPVLKGAADNNAQAMDVMSIGDVRNLLFGNGAFGGQDLIARDIQRARDDGIGTYNQVRVAYGLAPVTSFAQITSDPTVQQQLQKAYGTVDRIDPFEGGSAEDHARGSDMGPLFTKILADQFTRLRDGDRFFYLNQTFTSEEMTLLHQANTLGKVIAKNTEITNLQGDVFVFQASIGGTVVQDQVGGHRDPRDVGQSGDTVQLKDANGNLLATTTTDSRGRYSFDQQNGVSATGNYSVSLVVPAGFTQVSANPSTIALGRGGSNVTGINFEVAPIATHLQVSAPQGVQSGRSFDVLVQALDASNHLATGYTGTVHFTLGTTDAGATLPADYTFTASDDGQHLFHVTLSATGSQTFVAMDTVTGSIVGQAKLLVAPAAVATHFGLIPLSPAVAGARTSVAVVALDAANHVVTNYSGIVHFMSSDTAATLPANYTFTTSDHGVHVFSLTFATTGSQTLTAIDTLTRSIAATTHIRVQSRLPWQDAFFTQLAGGLRLDPAI